MKMPVRPSKLSQNKRLLTIGGLLLVMGFTGMWATGSEQWRTLSKDTVSRRNQADANVKAALSSESTRGERLEAIDRLAALSSPKTEHCKADWWYGWQQSVWPASRDAAESCRSAARRLMALGEAGRDLKQYLDDEKAIIAQLVHLKIDSKQSKWQTQASDIADNVADNLAKLTVSASVKPVLTEATTRVKAISQAWQAFEAASKKKDRTAYEKALAGLDDAYAGLGAVTDASDGQLKDALEEFKKKTS